MPSRTRQAPAEEAEEDSGLRGLSFNQPLSWRVGRSAIPIADLLERLQSLAQELRKLEQEEIEKESLRKVSQELASAHLLAHKDKGVRAWAACCLVDVLRLCAPDAPFTRNQLKVRRPEAFSRSIECIDLKWNMANIVTLRISSPVS